MFCPKCGTFNKEENSWCIRCGNNLVEEKVVSEVEVLQEKIDISTNITEKNQNQPKVSTKKEERIKDYLVFSILSAILGSVSFGTVALIFSGLTSTEISAGNKTKAIKYSAMARLFCIISLAIGVVKFIFIFIMLALVITASILPYYIY